MLQEERNRLVQSIFFEFSNDIDTKLTDSLITYLRKSNSRESDTGNQQEFLLDFMDPETIDKHAVQNIPVQFPNCNIALFPSDLYLFFKTDNIKDASPTFISQVGVIMTQENDVPWQ